MRFERAIQRLNQVLVNRAIVKVDLGARNHTSFELVRRSPAIHVRLRFATLRSALLKNGEQSQRHLLWHFKNRYLRRLAFIVVSDA